jgi:hypothetical protein
VRSTIRRRGSTTPEFLAVLAAMRATIVVRAGVVRGFAGFDMAMALE